MEKCKMIAEFIGRCGQYDKDLYTFKGIDKILEYDIWYTLNQAKFYSSYDWLMPVVNKIIIEFTEYNFETTFKKVVKSLLSGSFDKLYNAVIEFIEFYNNKK